jgi:galactoside O-acetyltransferase
MIKFFFSEIKQVLNFFVNYYPGNIGIFLRKFLYKTRFKKLGKNFFTEIGFRVTCPQNISVGDNAHIMKNCSLNSCTGIINIGNNFSINQNVDINSSDGGEILIGNDVSIGNNVVIRASDHIYKNREKKINESGHSPGKIVIEDNVWIASNCVILKNVTIKKNSVIGAGTVVKKNVDENQLAISNIQTNKKIIY